MNPETGTSTDMTAEAATDAPSVPRSGAPSGSRAADAPADTGRGRRIAGAAAAGLASFALALVAHAVSGADLPSNPILAGLAAFAVLGANLVALGRLPGWAVLLLLGAAQQVLHWLLGGLADAPSTTVAGSTGHHDGDVPVGGGGSSGHSPEVMLLLHTHLAAALLVGWVVLRHRDMTSSLRRCMRRAPRSRYGGGAPAMGGRASS